MNVAAQTRSGEAELRRRLLVVTFVPLAFSVLHHIEHVLRGTHVGWPVIPEVTPFTFSLVVYPIILLGIYLTARRAVWAGYWVLVALAGFAIIAWSHGPHSDEQIVGIYQHYANPVWGVVSVGILTMLLIGLVLLLITALRVYTLSHRW